MIIKKLHQVTGLTVTIFVTLHLFNHTCSIWGADKHIEIMNTLRFFYRNIFGETILLLAVLLQIITGFKLFKINRKIARTKFEKLQIYSGLYLSIFIVIHLSAVFVGRYLLHLDTNFYFGVAGLNTFPYNLFFIPYYGLAILSFFGHLASVHNKKIKHSLFGLPPKAQSFVILIFGFILLIILFYGLTNQFNGVIIPKEYKVLIGK